MALTLAQLITRVENNIGRTDPSDANVVDWLNDALRTLARRHDWRDLYVSDYSFNMTAGTYRYNFPSDMKACYGIRMIDGSSSRWLIEKTRRWLNQYEPYPDSMSNARPSYYCADGVSFDIIPPPDSAYTGYINYAEWPDEFSESTTTATADITNVDDVLIAYACAEFYRSKGQDDRANHWEAVFERRFRDARIVDNQRPAMMPVVDGVVSPHRLGPSSEYWNDPGVG